MPPGLARDGSFVCSRNNGHGQRTNLPSSLYSSLPGSTCYGIQGQSRTAAASLKVDYQPAALGDSRWISNKAVGPLLLRGLVGSQSHHT